MTSYYFLLFYLSYIPQSVCSADNTSDNISNTLQVSHFDCTRMQDNNMYSINQVAPCKISPEHIRALDAQVHVYQRSFRTRVNATMCRAKVQTLRFNCGMWSHSSIVHNQASITTDVILTPEDCRNAMRNKEITLEYWGKSFSADIDYDIELQSYGNAGVDLEDSTSCEDRGQIKHISMTTFMQNISLHIDFQTLEVYNPSRQVLPCTIHEEGCQSTTLDTHAYVWDAPDNCVLTKLFAQPATMLRHELHPRKSLYFLISDSTEKNDSNNPIKFDLRIRLFNDKHKICGKPEFLYRSNFENLFIKYTGGFDMNSGLSVFNDKFSSSVYRLSVDQDQNVEYSPLAFGWFPNGTSIPHAPWETFGPDHIDYELHLSAKLDFLMFYNSKQLRHSELTLLRNECELERTQTLTILMLALQNTRLAGYMLTGNRSMFLDTDGSVAWLYHCPPKLSYLKILDRCYDRIPIDYEGQTHFVDPITRQTFKFANEIECQGTYRNMFQLDLNVENSWYKLSPAPEPQNPPLIFEPTEIGHITSFPTYDTQRAGMYTPGQIKDFWDNVIHNSASDSILKKLTRRLLTNGQRVRILESENLERAMSMNNQFYFDSLLSPNYFTNQFKSVFGEVSFYLEKLGIYFAIFLFVKFTIQFILKYLEALEVQDVTGATVSYSKVILGTVFNLFTFSISHALFNKKEQDAQAAKESQPHYISNQPLITHEHPHRYDEEKAECGFYPSIEPKDSGITPLAPP